MVILLAGTKGNLHKQTTDRLRSDLRVARPGGRSPWYLAENPTTDQVSELSQILKVQLKPGKEKFRRTPVLAVMKNSSRLGAVTRLLEQLPKEGAPLDSRPVLIIDDEADQAGLNTAATRVDREASETYRAILELRKACPSHTYLMYTATPQAPLLLNLMDSLAPDFVEVLEAGPAYTGGKYFFRDHATTFPRVLKTAEVNEALDPAMTSPPEALQLALATYLLAVAYRQEGPLSMLVHPSQGTPLHAIYERLIKTTLESWLTLLEEDSPDRADLLDVVFSPAWIELKKSVKDLPPLEQLVQDLDSWISMTHIRVVNSVAQVEETIPWDTAPSWILIGGSKLDRGFTVEGLVVTFMPRGVGGGQMDTLQQRARFFGYKANVAPLCRAWLDRPTVDAFKMYVEHEEHLRDRLKEVAASGNGLANWKRQFLLDPKYKATRANVISLPTVREALLPDRWQHADAVDTQHSSTANVSSLEAWSSQFESTRDARDRRHERSHQLITVPIPELLNLLVSWKAAPENLAVVNNWSLILSAKLDRSKGSALASVWFMDSLRVRQRTSKRSQVSLHQGPSAGYPGDREFFDPDRVSLQVHRVTDKSSPGASWLALSLRVPTAFSGGMLLEA